MSIEQSTDDRPYDDVDEHLPSIEGILSGLDATIRGAYCLDFTTTRELGERGLAIEHERKRFHTRLMLELKLFFLRRNSDVTRWRTTCTSLSGETNILDQFLRS